MHISFIFLFLLLHILFTSLFFFFNDTATTEIYTLSLHDALPIFDPPRRQAGQRAACCRRSADAARFPCRPEADRSEEHTSELQSQSNLVCRLLLEKKKKYKDDFHADTCQYISS